MKKKRIFLTIMILLLSLVLIASLAACGGGGDSSKPDDDNKDPVVDSSVSTLLIQTIDNADALAAKLGGGLKEEKLRVALDVVLDVQIDLEKAAEGLEGLIKLDDVKEDVKALDIGFAISVDAVIDKEDPKNNVVVLDISLKTDNTGLVPMLSILGETKDSNTVIYLGERLTKANEMNWVKLDVFEDDYISWLAGTLFDLIDEDSVESLEENFLSTFLKGIKIGGMSLLAKYEDFLTGLFDKPNGVASNFFSYSASSDGMTQTLLLELGEIGGLLEGFGLDASIIVGLFDGMDEGLVTKIKSLIALVLGGDLDKFMEGKIPADKQPEIKINVYGGKEELTGFGLSYDGTKGPDNGVKLGLDIKNVIVKDLSKSGSATTEKAAAMKKLTERSKDKLNTTDVEDAMLEVEIDIKNLVEGESKGSYFHGLDYAKLAVNVYPFAKLSQDKDNYFNANFLDAFAGATLKYKRVGDEKETRAVVAVFDDLFVEDEYTGGLKIDVGPIYKALGETVPEQQYLMWGVSLTDEVAKAIQGLKYEKANENGGTPASSPAAAAAPVDLGSGANFVGKIVMAIINGNFEFGTMIDPIIQAVEDVLFPVVTGKFTGIAFDLDKDTGGFEATVTVKELYDFLMGDEGLIGGAGIQWEDDKAEGGKQTLVKFLNDLKLADFVSNSISGIVGATFGDQFWAKDSDNEITLKLDRTNGLKLTIGATLKDYKGKDISAEVGIKLSLNGENKSEAVRPVIPDWPTDDKDIVLFGPNHYNEEVDEDNLNAATAILDALLAALGIEKA